jgi:hypothetical protein
MEHQKEGLRETKNGRTAGNAPPPSALRGIAAFGPGGASGASLPLSTPRVGSLRREYPLPAKARREELCG